MATYVIGDVQGCFEPLQALLKKINFDDSQDQLWFTGDLINRGPNSLKTLEFIVNLGNSARTVLGNHDLVFLAVANQIIPFDSRHHTFQDLLASPQKDEWIAWLEQQPLLIYDAKLNYTLVHAGIYPFWTLDLAKNLAQELETILQSSEKYEFYRQMFGNLPSRWDPRLSSWDRARFIVNAFTRMRFCSVSGELELQAHSAPTSPPSGFMPWFEIPNRLNETRIVFGHWAALGAKIISPTVFALDSGCVWGGQLTALRLEDQKLFSVPGLNIEKNDGI